ncbi:MAG: rhomboid family intramembrane serine protease [Syntrophales bacterium]|jgi:rhomboid protease GluP|nr:rhomboid family intramembrane serine protease [Syntrophales bacterium]MDY0044213.1 rhomboid family intramembrane serine protease [Syntrophales bacterium]
MPTFERKSIICPNCRKLISSYEERCPYCGIKNPSSPWRLDVFSILFRRFDLITVIIATNVIFFILSVVFNTSSSALSKNLLTFFSPSDGSLLLFGATGTIPIDQFGWWWTLVSASYLHGGILHIFFNMMALYQLGPFVRNEFGSHRFFTIYTLTGIAGFFISYLAGISFTIGASASICGLIGATLFYGKSRGGSFGRAIYRQVLGWVVVLAVFGFIVPGINNWAHGGGIAAGIITGFLFGYNEKRIENQVDRMIATACLILTVFVLAWAVLRVLYFTFFSV